MSMQAIQTQMTNGATMSNVQYMLMLQNALVNAQQTTAAYFPVQTSTSNNTAGAAIAATTTGAAYIWPVLSSPPPIITGQPYYNGAQRLDFNKYLNASDLLEEFIDDIQAMGSVTKEEFLKLPVESFIKWLVIKAAEADDEPPARG